MRDPNYLGLVSSSIEFSRFLVLLYNFESHGEWRVDLPSLTLRRISANSSSTNFVRNIGRLLSTQYIQHLYHRINISKMLASKRGLVAFSSIRSSTSRVCARALVSRRCEIALNRCIKCLYSSIGTLALLITWCSDGPEHAVGMRLTGPY